MSDAMTAIITGVISSAVSIIGIAMANRKSTAVIEYKVDALDAHVKEHNGLIDRMYKAEKTLGLQDQRIKALEDER